MAYGLLQNRFAGEHDGTRARFSLRIMPGLLSVFLGLFALFAFRHAHLNESNGFDTILVGICESIICLFLLFIFRYLHVCVSVVCMKISYID